MGMRAKVMETEVVLCRVLLVQGKDLEKNRWIPRVNGFTADVIGRNLDFMSIIPALDSGNY